MRGLCSVPACHGAAAAAATAAVHSQQCPWQAASRIHHHSAAALRRGTALLAVCPAATACLAPSKHSNEFTRATARQHAAAATATAATATAAPPMAAAPIAATPITAAPAAAAVLEDSYTGFARLLTAPAAGGAAALLAGFSAVGKTATPRCAAARAFPSASSASAAAPSSSRESAAAMVSAAAVPLQQLFTSSSPPWTSVVVMRPPAAAPPWLPGSLCLSCCSSLGSLSLSFVPCFSSFFSPRPSSASRGLLLRLSASLPHLSPAENGGRAVAPRAAAAAAISTCCCGAVTAPAFTAAAAATRGAAAAAAACLAADGASCPAVSGTAAAAGTRWPAAEWTPQAPATPSAIRVVQQRYTVSAGPASSAVSSLSSSFGLCCSSLSAAAVAAAVVALQHGHSRLPVRCSSGCSSSPPTAAAAAEAASARLRDAAVAGGAAAAVDARAAAAAAAAVRPSAAAAASSSAAGSAAAAAAAANDKRREPLQQQPEREQEQQQPEREQEQQQHTGQQQRAEKQQEEEGEGQGAPLASEEMQGDNTQKQRPQEPSCEEEVEAAEQQEEAGEKTEEARKNRRREWITVTLKAADRCSGGIERREKLLQGHPWVFHGEIANISSLGVFAAGTPVLVKEADGEVVGVGLLNRRSSITVRMLFHSRLRNSRRQQHQQEHEKQQQHQQCPLPFLLQLQQQPRPEDRKDSSGWQQQQQRQGQQDDADSGSNSSSSRTRDDDNKSSNSIPLNNRGNSNSSARTERRQGPYMDPETVYEDLRRQIKRVLQANREQLRHAAAAEAAAKAAAAARACAVQKQQEEEENMLSSNVSSRNSSSTDVGGSRFSRAALKALKATRSRRATSDEAAAWGRHSVSAARLAGAASTSGVIDEEEDGDEKRRNSSSSIGQTCVVSRIFAAEADGIPGLELDLFEGCYQQPSENAPPLVDAAVLRLHSVAARQLQSVATAALQEELGGGHPSVLCIQTLQSNKEKQALGGGEYSVELVGSSDPLIWFPTEETATAAGGRSKCVLATSLLLPPFAAYPPSAAFLRDLCLRLLLASSSSNAGNLQEDSITGQREPLTVLTVRGGPRGIGVACANCRVSAAATQQQEAEAAAECYWWAANRRRTHSEEWICRSVVMLEEAASVAQLVEKVVRENQVQERCTVLHSISVEEELKSMQLNHLRFHFIYLHFPPEMEQCRRQEHGQFGRWFRPSLKGIARTVRRACEMLYPEGCLVATFLLPLQLQHMGVHLMRAGAELCGKKGVLLGQWGTGENNRVLLAHEDFWYERVYCMRVSR